MLQDVKIFNFAELKEIHRESRENFSEAFSLRIHRGLSWVQRAEKEINDPDASFIFYWIAFNSIYADIDAKEGPEKSKFNNFFNLILRLDEGKKIYSLLWIRFHAEIKNLLNNQFIFQPFWWHMIDKSAPNWEESFNKANKRVEIALREQNSHVIISILMERLYVLRNQLIHGGATWNSGKNRDQVVEGNTFIKDLVPCLIEIMLKNPNENWGDNNYPILYATKASLTSLAEKFSN